MKPAWRFRLALGALSLVGALLCSRSVADGLCLDDRLMLSTVAGPRILPASPPFDLFTFTTGQASVNAGLIARGVGPWYTSPNLRISFWRPLASLSHTLDFSLFPGHPAWMHLENLIWYATLVVAVGLLYRRFLGTGWVALLAVGLYAVHDAHGLSVGWIIARNTLMGATFAVLSLLAHDRFARDGWSPGRILGPVLFAGALLSSEATVTMLAYLAAHAVWVHRASIGARARAMAPYAAITCAWLIYYVATGHGASGSGVYVDPFREPLAFAAGLPGRVLLDLAGQLSGSGSPPALAFISIIAFTLCAVPLALVHRTAAFFLAGLAGSLLIVAGLSPDPRQLLHTGLGAFPVAALIVAGAAGRLVPCPRRGGWRALAVVSALCSLLLLGVLSAVRMPGQAELASTTQRAFDRYPLFANPKAAAGKTVVVVNAADPLLAGNWSARDNDRTDTPARIWSLTYVRGPVLVTRTGARELSIYMPAGHTSAPSSRMFRRDPLRAGDSVMLPGMRIDVMTDGSATTPQVVRYRFDMPLDDAGLVWLAWNGIRYGAFRVPELGRSVGVGAQPL